MGKDHSTCGKRSFTRLEKIVHRYLHLHLHFFPVAEAKCPGGVLSLDSSMDTIQNL